MACGWFAGNTLEVPFPLPNTQFPLLIIRINREMYAPPDEIDIYEPLSVRESVEMEGIRRIGVLNLWSLIN